jgi:hypothetical protein
MQEHLSCLGIAGWARSTVLLFLSMKDVFLRMAWQFSREALTSGHEEQGASTLVTFGLHVCVLYTVKVTRHCRAVAYQPPVVLGLGRHIRSCR